MEEVFMLWGGDEISIGTIKEILDRQVNFGASLEDIITYMFFNGNDETTIKLVIK